MEPEAVKKEDRASKPYQKNVNHGREEKKRTNKTSNKTLVNCRFSFARWIRFALVSNAGVEFAGQQDREGQA